MNLHITGAFKFLEDNFIHPAAGIDQGCAKDSQAPAIFNIPRRAEESLWAA